MSHSSVPKHLACLSVVLSLGLPISTPAKAGDPPSTVPVKAGAIDLRPKFRLGSDRRVVLKQESSQNAPDLGDADPAAGQANPRSAPATQRVTSTSELTLVFRPTQVSSDGATVEIVIDAIRASRHGGDTDDTFDSSKPASKKATQPTNRQPPSDPANDLLDQLMESQSLEKQLRPLVGEKMVMKLNADGDILEVRGGEKLAQALSPMSTGMEQLGGLSASPTQQNDLFKSIVGGPGRASANVGESWETRTGLDLSILGQMNMRTKSTLSSMRGSVAQLDIKGQLEPSSEAPAPGTPGQQAAATTAPKIDVTYGGTCMWDTEDGFVRSMNTRQLTTIRLGNSTKPTTISAETTTSITSGSGVSIRRSPGR